MKNILVTGGQGQLANNLKDLTSVHKDLKVIFKSSSQLDITNETHINEVFNNQEIDYCINCAAYTAVDNAEEEVGKALEVNELALKSLTRFCLEKGVILIHISTDFVFDGNKSIAYTEKDDTNPQNVYGLSKLKGENVIKESMGRYFIIRTSWLYSEYNNNFMKTMLRLSESREELSVVDDQISTPTYAKDLAKVILKIIDNNNENFGIYHYSNEGVASWYDFAHAIFKEIKSKTKLIPIKTELYPTPAKRPSFSVLDKSKIKERLNIEIPHWEYSLREAINNLKEIS